MIEASLEPIYDNQEKYHEINKYLHDLSKTPHMYVKDLLAEEPNNNYNQT